MKLTFKQIEPFVKNPDPKARVVLVYGPDSGLVAERSKTICKSVIEDLNDPFNAITLQSSQITDDAAQFFDEANAQSLMGGNRLILIKNGTDGLSVILKEYLENPSMDNLVVVEGDNLSTRSSLRKLCESDKQAAAVPCYVDDERNLAQIIRDMCTHAGYTIQQDALIAFSGALVGDRIIARNEIEKLLLYKGISKEYQGFDGDPIREKIGVITMDDIIASCGDVRDWSMDTLVYAVADGDIHKTHTITQSLFNDNIASIVLLRSIQNHFWRLLSVKTKIKDGMSQPDALKTLSPPIFFKFTDAFNRQLHRWTLRALEGAIDALNKAEAMSKQTGYSDQSLVSNCLIQLARYNPTPSYRRSA